MCLNIKQQDLPEAPAIFFLDQLLLKVDKAQQLSSSQTPQFFELLTSLLNHYFSVTQADPSTYPRIVEPTELIKRVYNQLENY